MALLHPDEPWTQVLAEDFYISEDIQIMCNRYELEKEVENEES